MTKKTNKSAAIDTTINNTINNEEVTTMTNTAITNLQVDNTIVTYERANRVSIQTIESGVGYRADFYRTHKKVATITSDQTGWIANPEATKSQNREDFRKFITEHAAEIGVDWSPEDQRTPANYRVPTYFNDEILKMDIVSLMQHDIPALMEKLPKYDGITITALPMNIEDMVITPKTTTAKGFDLSKMGVEDGKYLKTGNWAWAEIECTVVITANDQPIYQLMTVELVSGQLKKPHLTQTAWNTSIKTSLIEAELIPADEPKAEKPAKAIKKDAPVTDIPAPTHKDGRKKSTKSKTARGKAKGEETVSRVIAKIEAENAQVGNI